MAGDGWTNIKLGDVCTKIGSGATPKGGSSVYLDTGNIALIRSQNVYNDGFKNNGLVYISQEHADQLSNVEVQQEDVLLNITGDSVARCCQVDPQVLPARVNQHVAIIRTDQTQLNAQYLRYYLVSPQMQRVMLSWGGSGGTRNALTKGMIEAFGIVAPEDVKEQQAIACILGALDDKIELNRRMNRTLESMARAIFKSWFVDFDPVRAKSEGGKPPGLAPNIAELFPNSFGDSKLGEIPYGWDVMPLFDIATYVNGAAFKSIDFCNPGDGLPVVKIAELKNGITDQTKYSKRELNETQRIDTRDMLYSWSGSPDTSLDVFLWTRGPGLLNQHIFKVITNTGAQKRFVYYLLKHLRPTLIEIARNKQTTGLGHVTIADMKQLFVYRPSDPVLHAFDRIVGPLFNRCFSGEMESGTISDLRDTLLPKLISGDLRVTDAERIVERCV
jgi:type I restriction enzyme S subunit